jgi:hypothetical protein
MSKYTIRFKGGPGSGFHGHKGRKGQVGGSVPAGTSSYGNPNPSLDESTMTSKMEEWISDNAINPDGTVDVDKAQNSLWELAQDIPDEYFNNGEFPDEWSEWLDNAIANVSPEVGDTSDMADLADSMLADEDMKKYPGLDPYSIDLIKTAKRATDAGIKSYTDRQVVKDIARSAAEAINGRTKVGYTVYGSDTSHLSEDGTKNIGTFPMVAYGAESPAKVRGMINFLKDAGWKAVIGPENYGIIVGTIWDGVSNKEITKSYSIRLKGGAGSGNHGHKGIKGHQGGSLPQGSQNSGITEQQRSRAKFEQSQRDSRGYTPGLRPESMATDADFERAYADKAVRDAKSLKDFHSKYKGWGAPSTPSSNDSLMEKKVGIAGKPGYARSQIYPSGNGWRVFGIRYIGSSGNSKGMGDNLGKSVTTLEEAGKIAEEYLKRK